MVGKKGRFVSSETGGDVVIRGLNWYGWNVGQFNFDGLWVSGCVCGCGCGCRVWVVLVWGGACVRACARVRACEVLRAARRPLQGRARGRRPDLVGARDGGCSGRARQPGARWPLAAGRLRGQRRALFCGRWRNLGVVAAAELRGRRHAATAAAATGPRPLGLQPQRGVWASAGRAPRREPPSLSAAPRAPNPAPKPRPLLPAPRPPRLPHRQAFCDDNFTDSTPPCRQDGEIPPHYPAPAIGPEGVAALGGIRFWGKRTMTNDFATVVYRMRLLGFNAIRIPFGWVVPVRVHAAPACAIRAAILCWGRGNGFPDLAPPPPPKPPKPNPKNPKPQPPPTRPHPPGSATSTRTSPRPPPARQSSFPAWPTATPPSRSARRSTRCWPRRIPRSPTTPGCGGQGFGGARRVAFGSGGCEAEERAGREETAPGGAAGAGLARRPAPSGPSRVFFNKPRAFAAPVRHTRFDTPGSTHRSQPLPPPRPPFCSTRARRTRRRPTRSTRPATCRGRRRMQSLTRAARAA
jgi:hypothetical protein